MKRCEILRRYESDTRFDKVSAKVRQDIGHLSKSYLSEKLMTIVFVFVNREPDVQPEDEALFEAFWRVLFQVGRKHNQVTIPAKQN